MKFTTSLFEGRTIRLRKGTEYVTIGSRLLKPNSLKVLLPAITKVTLDDKINIQENENISHSRSVH